MVLSNFPEFSELKLEDKEDYNRFINRWPPFSDITFTTLHIWWNLDGQLKLSSLNNNLVISYGLPFDPENSGLGLIGENKVDESIETLFAYLIKNNLAVKLVHVPEFVVHRINSKAKYEINEEHGYHEYVMSSQQLAELDGAAHAYTRKKVRRFLREVEGHKLEVRPIDLSDSESKALILHKLLDWQSKFASKNDPERSEDLALQKTIGHSVPLDTQNLCIFIDNEFHGIVLYHLSHDRNHYILNHLKVDYSVPYMFDFLTNQVALKAVESGIEFLNMEMDFELPGLRQHKMGLRPVKFFKKYAIRYK